MSKKPISADELDQDRYAETEQLLLGRIREAKDATDRYFLYLNSSKLLMRMGVWEDSREFLIQSAQIALHHKKDFWLVLSHEKLGDLSTSEENWLSALHHYRYSLRKGGSVLDSSIKERLEAKASAARNSLYSKILSQDSALVPLSREYASGKMVISFVHRDIFLKTYFARCLECTFCHDWCCSFGADIDIQNVERIQKHREEILPFVRPPEREWFEAEYTYYEEYAGNQYTRINTQGPRCAFISKDQRGCGLHRYAVSKGMDYHEIKPLVCTLFPLSFEEDVLFLAAELDDDSLVCSGSGETVYRAMRDELKYYFGREFVEELDGIEKSADEDLRCL